MEFTHNYPSYMPIPIQKKEQGQKAYALCPCNYGGFVIILQPAALTQTP